MNAAKSIVLVSLLVLVFAQGCSMDILARDSEAQKAFARDVRARRGEATNWRDAKDNESLFTGISIPTMIGGLVLYGVALAQPASKSGAAGAAFIGGSVLEAASLVFALLGAASGEKAEKHQVLWYAEYKAKRRARERRKDRDEDTRRRTFDYEAERARLKKQEERLLKSSCD